MDLQEKKSISDVEDVVRILFTNDTRDVPVVDFLMQNSESILGSNGIHKCKNLCFY